MNRAESYRQDCSRTALSDANYAPNSAHRQKVAAFFQKALKFQSERSNHDDETLKLVRIPAVPIASAVSEGACIEGVNHEQRHHT